jgi:formylglycine-generating enzyme required for sulfatase activity
LRPGEKRDAEEIQVPAFRIGRYPVTQDLWEAVMGAGSNPSGFKGGNRPVEQVSWYDACVFCNRLSEREGLTAVYYHDKGFTQIYGKKEGEWGLPNEGAVFWDTAAHGYRLPTEAEWEYAGRGGEDFPYAGGNKLKELGWYEENSYGETKPVGLKYPNGFGLYDMSGHVWEWCWDKWEFGRVIRGGSWIYYGNVCRVANRDWYGPDERIPELGFRLARTI